MMDFATWAARWGIPPEALRELASVPGLEIVAPPSKIGTEGAVQALVRLEASRLGVHLWRNNRGAFVDERGVLVRYGLANDSKPLGDKLKSADLIGWRTHTVTVDDFGKRMALFMSREIKEPGWKYTGTPREIAQNRWHSMVLAAGGDSAFATGTGTIK